MLFQVLAGAILLLFYGCYIGKFMSQQRQGVQTDQLGRGKTGKTLLIECALKGVTALVVAAEVISVALDASCLPAWLRWIGAALGFAGAGVFAAAVLTMRDSWRAGVPQEAQTELVTRGIYSVSRNPAFLGFDLTYAGLLLMFCNWPLLVITVAAAVMLHLQIVLVEEAFLVQAFGKQYTDYAGKVGRYLGRRRS